MNDINSTSLYFNANWQRYQRTLASNTLYHREMGDALNRFIKEKFPNPLTIVDVGCGDCSAIVPILADKQIKNYIGIDAAPDILKMAEENMKVIQCKKEFICDDMSRAIINIPASIDIIYTSYAVHHLSSQEKFNFIQNAKNKLNKGGYLIMVDGVLDDNQTRDEWLESLANRMQLTQNLTQEELEFRMQHPRADDHPESIKKLKEFSQIQQWNAFDVLVNKGIFAFIVFSK